MAAHTQTILSSGKKHKLQSSTKEKDFRNIYDGGLYCLVLFWNSTKFFFQYEGTSGKERLDFLRSKK